jgi:hypothetical protein
VSYLDLPRFHLSGRFFANPSTINNEAVNYDPAQVLNSGPQNLPGAVGWNPPGQALWTLGIAVQTVTDATGHPVTSGDTLVGATLASVDTPNKAKLVDLDPQQQMLSQVWGLRMSLTLAGGGTGFTGTVAECALTDVWGRVYKGGAGGIETSGGYFQTVIQVTEWGDLSGSPVLQALRGQAGDTLSLKWAVDGYNGQFGTAAFGWGRMVATVGPHHAGEPVRFLGGRRMDGTFLGAMWMTPFQVDETRSVLVLDLGNSVATAKKYGGPFVLDTLTVTIDPKGKKVVLPQKLTYDLDTYTKTAGIYEVPLTAEQLALIKDHPVSVSGTGPGGVTGSTTEADTGTWAAIDPQFLRLDPGESVEVTFYAREWGQAWNTELPVLLTQIPNNSDNTGQPPYVGGLDPAAILIDGKQTTTIPTPGTTPAPAPTPAEPVTVKTVNGAVQVKLTGGTNPPQPPDRTGIDGQVYNLTGPWWNQVMGPIMGVPAISVLVFDAFTPATEPPTWWADIQPWMYGYARLYPGMRDILDISDYGTLTSPVRGTGKTGAQLVHQVFGLPRTDPNHMPVTRDLSGPRRAAFAAWVKGGCREGTQPASFAPTGVPRQPSPPETGDPHTIKSALTSTPDAPPPPAKEPA